MKKINRKGFTLIELLAVIVILAIILVVTVPNIINSINDARVSSLHNLAVSSVNTYNTLAAQDLLKLEDDKVLKTIPQEFGEDWYCIGELSQESSVALANVLGLSYNDLELEGANPPNDLTKLGEMTRLDLYCSAIRKKDGKIEIILIADEKGKFAIANKVVYALSSADAGATNDVE